MSRSGYVEDPDHLVLYRRTVENALRGKRGQKFLRELVAALEWLPKKRLISGALVDETGEVCATGAVLAMRERHDIGLIDPENPKHVAAICGIAPCMVAEIAFMNDEFYDYTAPGKIYEAMLCWAKKQLIKQKGAK